jgi:hypothetical protein
MTYDCEDALKRGAVLATKVGRVLGEEELTTKLIALLLATAAVLRVPDCEGEEGDIEEAVDLLRALHEKTAAIEAPEVH